MKLLYSINMNVILNVIFFVFLSLLLIITGISYSKKSLSVPGFLLANRSLTFFTAGLCTQSADMSGFLIVVIPSVVLASSSGSRDIIFISSALFLGSFFSWKLLGRRIRVYSEVSNDSKTIPSFYENRFKDNHGIIRVVSASIIIVISFIYTSILFNASTTLVSTSFGLSGGFSLFFVAGLVILYLFFGGFFASTFTGILKSFLLLIILIFLPIYMFDIFSVTQRVGFETEIINISNMFNSDIENIFTLIVNCIAIFIGCFGMPHVLTRYMAVKDKKQFRLARNVGTVWFGLCAMLMIVISLFLKQTGVEISSLPSGLLSVLNDPFMKALTFSAFLAALLSTADSQILLISSVFSHDVYMKIRKDASSREEMAVTRSGIIVCTLIICVLSLIKDFSVPSTIIFVFSAYGATFAPVTICSVFSHKITLTAAIASMTSGFVSVVIIKLFLSGFLFGLWILVFPLILSTCVLLIVSRLRKTEPEKAVKNELLRVNEIMKIK